MAAVTPCETSFILWIRNVYIKFGTCQVLPHPVRGVLPYMGYLGMCGLVINRVWFLHTSLELSMFFFLLEYFFTIIIDNTMIKSPF